MLKNQKGITLIALVITIIVLLILAGVSIAMLTGDNGLLTQAESAKTDTKKAEVIERVNMELQAQYGLALAGEAFDTEGTIEANLTSVDCTVDVTPGTSVSITVTGDDATGLTTAKGEVKKGSTGKWELKPVK